MSIKFSSTKVEKKLNEFVNCSKVNENNDIEIVLNGEINNKMNESSYLKGFLVSLMSLKGNEILYFEDCNYADEDEENRVMMPMMKNKNECFKYFQKVLVKVEKQTVKKPVKKVTTIDDLDADEIPVFTAKPKKQIINVSKLTSQVAEDQKNYNSDDIEKTVKSLIMSDEFINKLAQALKK